MRRLVEEQYWAHGGAQWCNSQYILYSLGACRLNVLLLLEHYSREVHNFIVAEVVHAYILCKSVLGPLPIVTSAPLLSVPM